MTKHTPGPWKSVFHKDTNQFRIMSHDGTIVAVMELSTDPDMDNNDARLIAAAPDLLEALKLIDKEAHQFNAPELWEAFCGIVRIHAQKAIAKAEDRNA